MTRVLPFIVILFCLFAGRPHNACAGTSVLATDNCTRIDNVDLGGAWDPNIATFKISGNLCMGAGDGTDAVERNNSVAWPADQYAKTTFGGTQPEPSFTARATLRKMWRPAHLGHSSLFSPHIMKSNELGRLLVPSYALANSMCT